MAKASSANFAFQIEKSVGAGTLTDMTSYITNVTGTRIDGSIMDITPFGAVDNEMGYAGFKSGTDVTIEGIYDDTATTGPDAVFKGVGDLRNVEFDWTAGGAKKTSGSMIIKSYERVLKVKDFTRYRAVLTWTGTITEA